MTRLKFPSQPNETAEKHKKCSDTSLRLARCARPYRERPFASVSKTSSSTVLHHIVGLLLTVVISTKNELREIDKKIAEVKSKGEHHADLVVRQNALQLEVKQLETDWSAADSQYKKTLETSQKLAKDYGDVVKNLNKAIDKEAGVTT